MSQGSCGETGDGAGVTWVTAQVPQRNQDGQRGFNVKQPLNPIFVPDALVAGDEAGSYLDQRVNKLQSCFSVRLTSWLIDALSE